MGQHDCMHENLKDSAASYVMAQFGSRLSLSRQSPLQPGKSESFCILNVFTKVMRANWFQHVLLTYFAEKTKEKTKKKIKWTDSGCSAANNQAQNFESRVVSCTMVRMCLRAGCSSLKYFGLDDCKDDMASENKKKKTEYYLTARARSLDGVLI